MYGYIYKTTNLTNNKIYIGQKRSDTFLGNSYLGSGLLLSKAVKKYGVDNFIVEQLDTCSSKQELDKKEQFYIKKYNANNFNIGYNIACGGQGGNLGDIVNKKISSTLKGHSTSTETRTKISKSLHGNKLSQETKDKISKANIGRTRSQCTIEKMKEAFKYRDNTNIGGQNKGKICINNGITNKFVDKEYLIPEGYIIGSNTLGKKKNMSNYYNSSELQQNRSNISSGCNNNMYGNGFKVSGGKNGKALYDYYFKNRYFECRKYLVQYLKNVEGFNISENAIRNIQEGTYGVRTKNKFQYVIDNLSWRLKDENKVN